MKNNWYKTKNTKIIKLKLISPSSEREKRIGWLILRTNFDFVHSTKLSIFGYGEWWGRHCRYRHRHYGCCLHFFWWWCWRGGRWGWGEVRRLCTYLHVYSSVYAWRCCDRRVWWIRWRAELWYEQFRCHSTFISTWVWTSTHRRGRWWCAAVIRNWLFYYLYSRIKYLNYLINWSRYHISIVTFTTSCTITDTNASTFKTEFGCLRKGKYCFKGLFQSVT